MKVKKIIASDMDGTLLPYYQEYIDPRAFDIIQKLEKKGVLFVPASGRTIHSLKELFYPMKENLSYLSENGAVVWREGEEIVETPFQMDKLKEILDYVYNTPGIEAYMTTPTDGFIMANDKEFGEQINNTFQPYSRLINSIDEIEGRPVKLTAITKGNKSEEFFGPLKEKFGDIANVMMAGPNVVDFCIADKGYGLKILTEYYGLTPDDVYAFGDNYNDLSMLEYAGNSYMMKTDDPVRLAAANHVCTNVIDELEKILETLD